MGYERRASSAREGEVRRWRSAPGLGRWLTELAYTGSLAWELGIAPAGGRAPRTRWDAPYENPGPYTRTLYTRNEHD